MLRLLVLTSVASVFRSSCSTAATIMDATTMSLKALDFEVYGRVQGVFFRKYTKEEADRLGIRGWCKNTSNGTVLGHMQGPTDKVETMMHWLKTIGSPSSKIDKAVFRNPKDISEFTFKSFDIRKD